MDTINQARQDIKSLPLPFDKEIFTSSLIGKLAQTLQELVGAEEASGFLAAVGEKIGNDINDLYKDALGAEKLTLEQVAVILEDLKARIKGDFYLISMDEEKIVLGNRQCPFAKDVVGRPSLCMMTSNVFGTIAAQNLGYGQVELNKTIVEGQKECLVTIYLKPKELGALREGVEYFKN